ncbi:hypothetical protein Tco_0455093 [Tanacetum coccineum]
MTATQSVVGIGRSMHSVEQTEKIDRPINKDADRSVVLMDFLWLLAAIPPLKEDRKDSQLYYQPPLASCVGGTTSFRWVPIQNRTFSTHITSAELEIDEKNSTLRWVEHYIYGRKKNRSEQGHCSLAFSSDSLLENTTSFVIMSDQTQANINTPVLVTDLLPRCRGRPPLTDISNEYLDHGDPTNICGACNASLWDFEARLKRPFHNLWSYSTCCGYGKVKVAKLKKAPKHLLDCLPMMMFRNDDGPVLQ